MARNSHTLTVVCLFRTSEVSKGVGSGRFRGSRRAVECWNENRRPASSLAVRASSPPAWNQLTNPLGMTSWRWCKRSFRRRKGQILNSLPLSGGKKHFEIWISKLSPRLCRFARTPLHYFMCFSYVPVFRFGKKEDNVKFTTTVEENSRLILSNLKHLLKMFSFILKMDKLCFPIVD